MTTAGFLAELRARQIHVSVEGDRLRCTGPKGALTAELQSELLRRKPEILSCLRDEPTARRRQPPPIVPVPRTRPLPLSFGQQRLWFLHRMDPASAAYNLQLSIPLPVVDVPLLERALATVIARHETLRTAYQVVDGQPAQIVLPPEPVTVPVFDLAAMTAEERARESQRIKWELFAEPFDLAAGRVIRFAVLRLPDGAGEFVLVQHHIATDGWSVALLYDELRAISEAYLRGEDPVLPSLPVQYADYACWQREWLQGEVLAEQLAYWRRKLEGLTALELPTDRQRPAVQSFEGAVQMFALSAGLSDRLRQLSREHDVTLYMTLLAAFQALLARYSGQPDIVVGTSNGNRGQVEIERLIGFFVNTQVVRTDFGGNPTFREVLERVSTAALEAYEHQDVPFEKLVEELQPRRDLSRSPLFDVLFILQNSSVAAVPRALSKQRGGAAEGIRASELPVRKATVKFDLTLAVAEIGDRICGSIEYSTALFDDETITRMQGHYEDLLQAFAADPSRRIASISLLSDADRAVYADCNATLEPIPDGCAHDLVAAQVRRTPDAVAVVQGGETLTYAELDALSTNVAHRLIAAGVRPGSYVGICVDRTPRMVAAVLGALKAGAAYLPLDPEYPQGRLAYILEDSGIAATVTERALWDLLPAAGGPRIALDEIPLEEEHDGALPAMLSPEGVAYVLYTSGSTGRPKGVAVPHRAVVNLLATMAKRLGVEPSDVLLAVTTLSFDIATLELLLPLTVGARVVVARRAEVLQGVRLGELLDRSGATLMQATPATWRLLVDAGWKGSTQLRMLSGGEALSRSLADALLERGSALWNLYGPTETTIYSTGERVASDGRPVGIGGPVGNTTIHVLDADGTPVPRGFTGELYVGGAGLAHGYLGRPDLTAERFLPDPFSQTPGARMYRTGDVVKRRADGRVEYLGRADHQVKLRGFRIELAEIETVLMEADGVAEAIAAIRTDPAGPRLVAYVRPSPGLAVDLAQVRSELREKLPAYMVPAHILTVDAWPRTPNGKIDRKALPAPPDDVGSQAAYVAPQSDAERRVAEIWRDVLKVSRVGANDNFFDLGGHSLLVVSLQDKLAAAFNRPVRVVDLFRFPTVQAIARHLTREGESRAGLAAVEDRASRHREAARRRRATREDLGQVEERRGTRGGHGDLSVRPE